MQLHEQTQRFILLLIFYLFGPILTFGIIGGIVLRKLPNNARNWEYHLLRQTSLHWKIQSVEFRSPGFVRLHQVKILDDAAQTAVFEAPKVDVRLMTDAHREKIFPDIPANTAKQTFGNNLNRYLASYFPSSAGSDTFWQINVPVSLLKFDNYTADSSALFVQNTLQKLFARILALSDVPVQFVFEQVAVVSEKRSQKEGDKFDLFRFVQGNLYKTPEAIRSDWTFQIKDVSEVDTEKLSFVQSLNSEDWQIAFQTGKQSIPCDLAAVFCPMFSRFSGGSFQGEFVLRDCGPAGSRTIRLNSVSFKELPLAPFIRTYSPFAVEGTIADFKLNQAVFGAEEFQAQGSFQILNGSVEAELFHRCVDNFKLTVTPPTILESPLRMIPFSACTIHFRLEPDGMVFWADQLWNNAFMYHQKENKEMDMAVYLPPGNGKEPIAYNAILSIFAPNLAPVVPLTTGTKQLLPMIPIK